MSYIPRHHHPPMLSFEIWCAVYTHYTSQFQVAPFQVLSGHVGLVAPILGSASLEDLIWTFLSKQNRCILSPIEQTTKDLLPVVISSP